MKILIDADGCPVVDLTMRLAEKYGIECTILCDTSHEFNREGAKTVVVEKGADSVDFRIVNLVGEGDIVVTQDYGLAAMCLARKAIPVSQNGMVYTDKNIDQLLFTLCFQEDKKSRRQNERSVQAHSRTGQSICNGSRKAHSKIK